MSYECAAQAAGGRTGVGTRWIRLGTAQYVPAELVEARDVPSC